MWVGNVYSVKKDAVSLMQTTKKKSNFPVKIGDNIIYYAKNNFDVERYKCTDKYKMMTIWYSFFRSS